MQCTLGRIKWPANGPFESLFENLVRVRDRRGGIPQTMHLAGLMSHSRENLGNRNLERLLIVTDHAATPIPQGFDRLEHALCQSEMIGREQGDHL